MLHPAGQQDNILLCGRVNPGDVHGNVTVVQVDLQLVPALVAGARARQQLTHQLRLNARRLPLLFVAFRLDVLDHRIAFGGPLLQELVRARPGIPVVQSLEHVLQVHGDVGLVHAVKQVVVRAVAKVHVVSDRIVDPLLVDLAVSDHLRQALTVLLAAVSTDTLCRLLSGKEPARLVDLDVGTEHTGMNVQEEPDLLRVVHVDLVKVERTQARDEVVTHRMVRALVLGSARHVTGSFGCLSGSLVQGNRPNQEHLDHAGLLTDTVVNDLLAGQQNRRSVLDLVLLDQLSSSVDPVFVAGQIGQAVEQRRGDRHRQRLVLVQTDQALSQRLAHPLDLAGNRTGGQHRGRSKRDVESGRHGHADRGDGTEVLELLDPVLDRAALTKDRVAGSLRAQFVLDLANEPDLHALLDGLLRHQHVRRATPILHPPAKAPREAGLPVGKTLADPALSRETHQLRDLGTSPRCQASHASKAGACRRSATQRTTEHEQRTETSERQIGVHCREQEVIDRAEGLAELAKVERIVDPRLDVVAPVLELLSDRPQVGKHVDPGSGHQQRTRRSPPVELLKDLAA